VKELVQICVTDAFSSAKNDAGCTKPCGLVISLKDPIHHHLNMSVYLTNQMADL
jgi:hypothetical protein